MNTSLKARMAPREIKYQLVRRIVLPGINSHAPGRLHTVLQDIEGNFYYSDELNHSVVSLDKSGCVRWHKTGQGQAPGQFWYPKGMALGALKLDGRNTSCLAVCDSWNSRLQIFDLDGWVVPKGSPNKKVVMDYLKFATDTQRLADQAKYISYGPARASSAPMVGKHASLGIDMAPHMPTNPANAKHTLLYNYNFWADNVDDLNEKFASWLNAN